MRPSPETCHQIAMVTCHNKAHCSKLNSNIRAVALINEDGGGEWPLEEDSEGRMLSAGT